MPFERHYVEVKSDARYDQTGNIAIEIADDHGDFAHCTGVGKSVTMGTNAVYVHALGGTGRYAVYNPDDMVEYLAGLRNPRVVSAQNRDYRTWSVLLSKPEQRPPAPLVITGGEHLPETVRAAFDGFTHHSTADVLDTVRSLQPALPDDLRVKNAPHAAWAGTHG